MSLQTCWRCLARASNQSVPTRLSPQPSWTAAFSTSPSLSILPPKKTPKKSPNNRQAQQNVKGVKGATFIKKKPHRQATDKGKKPAIGERKALRKRIVLSNNNALEVQGLNDITARSMTDEGMRGQVLGVPEPVVDQLRAVEAFKVAQAWPLFRRPAMLMRKDTLDMAM